MNEVKKTVVTRELIVSVNDFNGPLDFLYQLIIERKKSILDISVLDISISFVEYMRTNMSNMTIDLITDNLSIITHLIELKSKKLLPIHENNKNIDNEIERDKFIQRILMYKKFKEIVPHLEEKFQERKLMLVGNNESEEFINDNQIIEELPDFVSPTKLLNAMKNVYKEIFDRKKFQNIMNIEIKELSIEEITAQMIEIIDANKLNNKITLKLLLSSIPFKKMTKQYFAVSFVAILVLTRNGLIVLSQNLDISDDIFIEIIDLDLTYKLDEKFKMNTNLEKQGK